MENINFFTPITYSRGAGSLSQSFLEFTDDYFFLGGEKAFVHLDYVKDKSLGVELVYVEAPWFSIAIKIISYFTVILPTLLLITKCILRSIHHFYLLPPLSNGIVLKQHEPVVIENLVKIGYPRVLAQIIAGYVTENVCFDGQKWKEYFGVEVGIERELNADEFYRFWFRRDPLYPNYQVCETHLPPIYRPRMITNDKGPTVYNHQVLCGLIQAPQKGTVSHYRYQSNIVERHWLAPAGEACWFVMRTDTLARGELFSKQVQAAENLNGMNYENELSAIDLATVVLARHVMTGERYFGGTYCYVRETCWTYDDPHSQILVGGLSSDGLPFVAKNSQPRNSESAFVLLRKF